MRSNTSRSMKSSSTTSESGSADLFVGRHANILPLVLKAGAPHDVASSTSGNASANSCTVSHVTFAGMVTANTPSAGGGAAIRAQSAAGLIDLSDLSSVKISRRLDAQPPTDN